MKYRENLRKQRKKAGLTQFELSQLIHYTRAHISKIETGAVRPSNRFVSAIERVLKKKDVPEQGQYSRPNNTFVCPQCGAVLKVRVVSKLGG